MKSKLKYILIVINLILISIILLGKIHFLSTIVIAITKAFVIPVLISTLIYYIIRPLHNIFIKKGISYGKAGLLTLVIFTSVLGGIVTHFTNYAYIQFKQVITQLIIIMNDKEHMDGIISWIDKYIDFDYILSLAAGMVKNYMQIILRSFLQIVKYSINSFSVFFFIVVIIYYMLRDGHKLKDKILNFVPKKYKDISSHILSDSDEILNHYVTGQAKVALSLSIMIFLGYKSIAMPNAMLLSAITFILAFVPFIGFFISMIIPIIIAINMGYSMMLKLAIVFVVVETLKGRVVVPLVMSKSIDIHPITDIFLVIVAVAIGGPFAAFAVVPIYAIIKNAVIIIKKSKAS